jgi:hypothetical protein
MERRYPPVLPRHVVGCRGDGSERRAANDQLGAAEARQIREVRVAAGKLRDLHLAREVETRNGLNGKVDPEVRRQRVPIDLLGWADGPGLSLHKGS